MLMLFLKEIRSRWLVHMLIICLMAFIIAILIIQSSLNSSAEEKIKELSHELGKGMLVVPQGTDLESFYSMQYGPQVMPDDYGDRIKASPLGRHAGKVEPLLYGNITVQGADLIIVGRKVRSRRYSNPDFESIAIGSGVAQSLSLKAGDTVHIKGHPLKIARVVDPPPKGYDMALFVPMNTAQAILDKPGKINALNMGGCWCKLDIPAFAASVESTLPGTMAITVEGMAKAQIEVNAIMERYSVLLWITGTILVIGSIVFLILYMIRKGEREIGLLLSIGISPGKIIVKNIVISIITAVVGALFGHILSVPLMSWFGKVLMRIGLVPSWQYLPHFVFASVIIALIAASFPSLYITRLDPTRLLREE
ncbi:MAG: ABC transporter permease [Nitrospiraceae bacterium]|nr:MAG: ABC transporter permease [bacterium]UCF87330.1 MAG: ABC transporter permease [Nitrospiraceae bacterium]